MKIIPEWQQIDFSKIKGTVLVVGAPNTGKSTFARFAYSKFRNRYGSTAYLDGDPGQSVIGPPSTISVALAGPSDEGFPPGGRQWQWFVGACSPVGHMLNILVGFGRLTAKALGTGAAALVCDTSGFVDPKRGGAYLKWAKLDLLRPVVLFAIQQNDEIEPLLAPLRRSRRVRVVELPPAAAVRVRSPEQRRAYRAERFRQYFTKARTISLDGSKLAVFPFAAFDENRLVALENKGGYTLGLGLIQHASKKSDRVTISTPLQHADSIDGLRMGHLKLDPHTFQDLSAPIR